MAKKTICFIANGYAEEMIAANLMEALSKELLAHNKLDEYQLIGASLVSSGQWFQEKGFPTFFSGGVTPSGGFPTKSWKGFFDDMMAGAFSKPFLLSRYINEWGKYYLACTVVVGDFLLMMTSAKVAKKHRIPLVFVPTAKSNYIQPHFRIEKKYIKKHASLTFPRDLITANDFSQYGIPVEYHGNLIQDLYSEQTQKLPVTEPVVALLPGSRNEAYKNICMMLDMPSQIITKVHWAMVVADSLDKNQIIHAFEQHKWKISNPDDEIMIAKHGIFAIYLYPNSYFDRVIASCYTAISLAGTATEQIIGLGKPVIAFKGSGPQSSHKRMIANKALLGDAFIYEKNYHNVVPILQNLLHSPTRQKQLGDLGRERMGQRGATQKVAHSIFTKILLQDT